MVGEGEARTLKEGWVVGKTGRNKEASKSVPGTYDGDGLITLNS